MQRTGWHRAETEFCGENWQAALDIDKTGKIKDTLTNISIILKYDENLKNIVYNQFKNMLDVVGALPWKQVKPGWSDTDLACAKMYFERMYGIWSPTKFKDALLAVASAERLYHPVKDYLSALKWDGVKRVDTLLVDYLGAEDTPYVRAVTRKTLVAAVARIFKPGTKFDSILVLNGKRGIGKSTLFARLGRQWFSDSLSISDMKDKTASEKLQGYWILEISELNGMKKVDVETIKSFISRTDDKYRQAYGVSVESHPRSCIIIGTTNSDGGFLRDITGNRRFFPVRVSGQGKYKPWELTQVDQIWAEAVEYYNRGEELFLKDDAASQAYAMQRDAMETDDREGLVDEYLNTLLPEEWPKMDLFERRSFLNGSEFGESRGPGRSRGSACAQWKSGASALAKTARPFGKVTLMKSKGFYTSWAAGSVIQKMHPANCGFPVMESKKPMCVLPMRNNEQLKCVAQGFSKNHRQQLLETPQAPAAAAFEGSLFLMFLISILK